jgi:general secretion pathway protein I
LKWLRLSMVKNSINKRNATGPEGFTLMEILAALLLIGLALPAIMKGVSLAGILASDSARQYEALNLAEEKLAETLLQADWQDGSTSGDFESDEYKGYEWTMNVSDWTQAGLKQVDVAVFWETRGRTREIRLSTLVYDAE